MILISAVRQLFLINQVLDETVVVRHHDVVWFDVTVEIASLVDISDLLDEADADFYNVPQMQI